MVEVFGLGDDLVILENSAYENGEIGCYSCDVRIWFADGTVILASRGKDGWKIVVEEQGTAEQRIDENTILCSDVFYIEAEVGTHEVIDRR